MINISFRKQSDIYQFLHRAEEEPFFIDISFNKAAPSNEQYIFVLLHHKKDIDKLTDEEKRKLFSMFENKITGQFNVIQFNWEKTGAGYYKLRSTGPFQELDEDSKFENIVSMIYNKIVMSFCEYGKKFIIDVADQNEGFIRYKVKRVD